MTVFVNDDNEQLTYSGEDILLTKQVASFRDFTIRGDLSVSFSIANSSENRKALGYYGLTQTDSPIFSENKFNLVKDGNVLTRGYIVIEADNQTDLDVFFISGNANWFRSLEFTCKNVRNQRMRFTWNWASANYTKARTYGIVFPVIDWTFGRQKFDKYNFVTNIIDESTSARSPYSYVNLFPCLYLHTLVTEISKVANIKIAGSLIDDKFYQSLLITPEGPELYNDQGKIINAFIDVGGSDPGFYENGGDYAQDDPDFPSGLIHIQDIAPDIEAVEIIKWLCFTFGCVPFFDEYSQTLYLNIIDKFKKEDAEDWSEYLQSYKIQYDQYQSNYLRVPEATEQEILDYNIQNPEALFGELNIQSEKADGSSQDLYTSLFAPVRDDLGSTPLQWATPFIQFNKLEDGDEIEYTSVTDNGGKAQFNCTFNFDVAQITTDTVLAVRVDDSDGVYTGIHLINIGNGKYIVSGADYISDSTGFLYIQKLSYNDAGPRVLVAIPNYPVANFMAESSIELNRSGSFTHVMYAYYHKPTYTSYSNLNGYRPGLAYSTPDIVETIPTSEQDNPPLPILLVTIAITSEALVYGSANYYYKVGSGAWTLLTSNNELDQLNNVYPTYTFLVDYKIEVTQGDTLQIGCKDNDGNNINFGLTDSPAATYNTYCGQDPNTSFIPTADVTKYVNLKVTVGTPNVYTTC